MRRFVLLLFVTTLFGQVAAGKDRSDWKAVQRVKPGTEVEVHTLTETVEGRFVSATDTELRLDERVRGTISLLTPRTISRDQVKEVYRTGKKVERRVPGGQLLLSSAIGLGVGIGIGAAYDRAHPNFEDPGQGKLVFGTVGAFTGPAFMAIGKAIYAATHRRKMLYRVPTSAAVP